MSMQDEFEQQGNWLFLRRGYLPFLLVPLTAIAFINFDFPFQSYLTHEMWEFGCLGISFLGLVVRSIVVGYAPARTSGRNTKCQIADELNTAGAYSIVRHPLYLGNFLIGLGISMIQWVWWLPVIYTLAFWLYYERIMFAEEAFLRQKFGPKFDDWAAATPAFWPKLSSWRRPALPFSFRNVLRREYAGLMVVVLGHTVIELFERLTMDHHLVWWEPLWMVFSLGGVAIYLVLRTLKKRTTLLDVPGR